MGGDPRDEVFALLEAAVTQAGIPGCEALVWERGAELLHQAHGVLANDPQCSVRGVPVERDTAWDLASLTKVLATTTLAAVAIARGRVDLDAPLPTPWSRACPGATLTHLLEHSTGLAVHRELFLRHRGTPAILEAIAEEPPRHAPGAAAAYGDLGFILLGAWLERIFDRPLDQAFDDVVAGPLGVAHGRPAALAYRPGPRGPEAREERRIAPTEVYRRELHPAGAPSWVALRESTGVAHGEVHDDNAWAMGGVAGHAGLFGTVHGVLAVARAWLEDSPLSLPGSVRGRFWSISRISGHHRRLGWDAPTTGGSTGDALTEAAAGHLGYTGTSLWIEPDRGRIYVLLSNRVHPTRAREPEIRALRQAFHRAAARL